MTQHSSLPKDARTVLATQRQIDIQCCAGGDYYYFGIKYSLSKLLDSFPYHSEKSEIKIAVNVDVIPLFKSSNTSLWTILGSVKDMQAYPFPIAIFCSSGKPTCLDEYLKDFVSVMKHLESDGFEHEGRHFSIAPYAVICDAPARAHLKCIKTHSGYASCERCVRRGEWCGKVVFQDVSCELRTDSSFEHRQHPDHHNGSSTSPFFAVVLRNGYQFSFRLYAFGMLGCHA